MTDEVKRISKLVAEGKLSPEDAAELIDAFYASEKAEAADATTGSTEKSEAGSTGESAERKSPAIQLLLDTLEKLAKDGSESVNWQEVGRQAKETARRGMNAVRTGLEDLSKGKVNLGWLNSQEVRNVTLPLVIPAGKALRVENALGDIKIVGGFDIGSATAEAKFKGATQEEAKAKAEAYTPIIEESDHLVLIRQPDVSGLSVDLEIQMPGTGNVEIKAERGDVQVLDTGGGCRIQARSGDVKLRGLNGVVEIDSESGDLSIEDVATPSLTIESKSGDIKLHRVRGNINARSATGELEISASSGKTIAIESVSGDVRLDIDEAVTGSINVRTVNGDSHISVGAGSDARVILSSLRGDVACDLDLADCHRQDQRITGKLGNGTGNIDISAVTGDINLDFHDAQSE